MALSDYADWWYRQKRVVENIMSDWVYEHHNWAAATAAGTVIVAMDFAGGFVDALRLGQGVAKGGWRGYGEDALRVLVILGPLGRAGGMLSRFIHVRNLRLAVTTNGITGPCTFTAVNNAMTVVSGRARNLFITAKDAAKALGIPLAGVAKTAGGYEIAAWIDDLVPFLKSHGAKIKMLTNLTTIEDIAKAAKAENGVTIFAIRCKTVNGADIVHSVIAVRGASGQIRYADYGGRLVESIPELIKNLGYGEVSGEISLMQKGGGAAATVVDGLKVTGMMENAMAVANGTVLVIEGVTVIETHDGAELAMPVAITSPRR